MKIFDDDGSPRIERMIREGKTVWEKTQEDGKLRVNKTKLINYAFAFVVISFPLAGCVGIGAPVVSPYENVRNAQALLAHGRQLPAVKLIQITIETSQKKGDDVGLALGYHGFADFLRYHLHAQYMKNSTIGSIDPSVTYENRFEKAAEYWKKAIDLYERQGELDGISNAYLNLATLEASELNNKSAACPLLDTSLKYNEKFEDHNPGKKVSLPQGYSTFREYIDRIKKQCGCDNLE